MSSKSPYKAGAPPKYLNDFSKALAGEVRILLQEVGKLRDERRQLQQDISELMAIKARHGADVAAWVKPEAPPPEPEPAPAEPAPAIEAKPGWKTVHKKPERKPKAPKALPPPATPAPPPPPDPTKNLPSWATWRPNPLYQPTPSKFVPPLPVPPTPRPPGLFGYGDP
ncbi:hypothetical protein AURDEDRAFT_186512 [Auricularia subglabra TFB-10046 SS5]|nr:hypothetical protein AURDEDRAFT_186512 [Auricularia subglabra TFB-10046 SS5]